MEPYPRGTKLADVPPEFRGMPLADYLAECKAFENTRADKWIAKRYPDGPPLMKKRIWTGRDSYGWRSAGASVVSLSGAAPRR